MAQKKRRKFLKRMKTRLAITIAAIFALTVVLVVNIIIINVKSGDEYEQKILTQQGYSSTVIPYKRGDILDCNGTVLATSEKIYTLILEPKNILEKEENAEITKSALKEYFGMTDAEITEALSDTDSYYELIRKDVTYEEVRAFDEYKATSEGGKVRGIRLDEQYQRVYPNDTLACHLLGYTTGDNIGMSGLEGQYNSLLNGTNGRSYSYLNESYGLTEAVESAENGYNIITTIDGKVQSIVQEKVDTFMDETGAKNVSVLVMNPNDCSVLALYNSHAYNPNDAYDLEYTRYLFEDGHTPDFLTKFADFEDFKANATDQEKADALQEVWKNFAISDSFEPGSTYKAFTIAGALQENLVTQDNIFECNGGEQKAEYYIQCSHTHGTITLSQALEFSCNDALMQIGKLEGPDIFDKYQQLFGFGKRTNIDIPGEESEDSMSILIYHDYNLNEVELATSSFGQGATVTMIQLGTAFCSAINGGYYYQPRVARRVEDEDGNVIDNLDSILVSRTISEEVSAQLRQSLLGVVEDGTGGSASVEGYSIGGKTGTAEKIPRNNGKYLLSFIGFAPVDDPQVVIYVVVDEPDVEVQSMSGAAKRIFSDIAAEVFPYMNIYRTDDAYVYDPETAMEQEATAIYEGAVPENDVAGGTDNPYVSEETQTTDATTEATTETTTEATTEAAPTE